MFNELIYVDIEYNCWNVLEIVILYKYIMILNDWLYIYLILLNLIYKIFFLNNLNKRFRGYFIYFNNDSNNFDWLNLIYGIK